MMHILPPQLIRLKHEWKSLVFWLVLPLIATLVLMKLTTAWQDETSVPIGISVEEESELVNELLEQLEETTLLQIHYVDKAEGLRMLTQHELDSLYVIRSGYEEKVLENDRNRLVEAYASNRSFAYTVVKEIVTSYVQEDVARSKAAFELRFVYEQYDQQHLWSYEDIITRSKERQSSADLLTTSFSYESSTSVEEETTPLFNVYGIWVLFASLSTFFLFDWVIKEQREVMQERWLFTKSGFYHYAMKLFTVYTVILLFVDLLSTIFITHKFHASLSILALVVFRVTFNLFVLFIASRTIHLWTYYIKGAVWTVVLVVIGGALVPIDRIVQKWPIIKEINPIYALLSGQISYVWGALTVILFIVWRLKGSRLYA